ncbi:uncharacterized protein LOC136038235 isoform X2 [Artemia franciscana]|uniref:uncharacterized protein LOC136038235 isoform X2 n=1 Tax=Artemia franciscana TaxID=6661 RepID=UPI0032DB6024
MSSNRKGAKSPRNAMSVLLSSGILNGLGSMSNNTDKTTNENKEKKSRVLYSGYLLKLSGKTVLSGGNWKRKFFVLEKKRLVYYESEEAWNTGSRVSGFISLEFYDLVEEKETRKATNVFFIGSSDKNLFETTRHYFSAETLPEMTAWMSHIRAALKEAKRSQKNHVYPDKTSLEDPRKADHRTKNGNTTKAKQKHKMDVQPEASSLQPLTRSRTRGPTGRKLPTNHRATLLGEDTRNRSNSLTSLEAKSKEESRRSCYLMSRSVDLSDGEETYQSISAQDKRLTLYEYSSDENAVSETSKLDSSVTSAIGLVARKEIKEKKPSRQSFGSTPSLILECEEAVKPLHLRHYNTAPTATRKSRRGRDRQMPLSDSKVTDTLNDLETEWELESTYHKSDLPHGSSKLMGVLHYLHLQTIEIRKTLIALEEDSADARRDMGALQENLTVVRTATNSTSDRIGRLQSTLNNVEKQIGVAAKEGHMLEQRAIRALEAAETAEKEFSRLRSECQSLILQMKSRRNSDKEKREDSPIFDTLPDTPSGSVKESFILSSSPSFLQGTKGSSNAPPRFEAPNIFEFGVAGAGAFSPPDFKFFGLSNSIPSSAATSTPRVQSPAPSKSAVKQDKESQGSKSVTFEDDSSLACP